MKQTMTNETQLIDTILSNQEHLSPKKRIKEHTKQSLNKSISEIFQVPADPNIEIANQNLHLEVGDAVTLDSNLHITNENQYKCAFHIVDAGKFEGKNITGALVIGVDKIHNIVHLSIEKYAIESYIQHLINNLSSQKTYEGKAIEVRNLQLVKGGYKGKVILYPFGDNENRFAVEYNAFIPGSHIELNAITDFESYNGKTVYGFVYGYKPENTHKLIISCREYQKHLGQVGLMDIYDKWCDNKKPWKEFSGRIFKGRITGVMNSTKVKGVYVEVPALKISFLQPLDTTEQILSYRFNQEVEVVFKGFENQTKYDELSGQSQIQIPFEWKNGILERVNVTPILELRHII